MQTHSEAAVGEEVVWAWDGGAWWREVERGCLLREKRGQGPRRDPTAREVWRGTWLARATLGAVEEVLVQHHELDATRRRLVGDLGGEVVINDALWLPSAERWTLGPGYIVGWKMGAPCVLIMGMRESGEEVCGG